MKIAVVLFSFMNHFLFTMTDGFLEFGGFETVLANIWNTLNPPKVGFDSCFDSLTVDWR